MDRQFASEHKLAPSRNDAEVTRCGRVFTRYNVVTVIPAVGALDAWGAVVFPALAATLLVASTVMAGTSARLVSMKS